MNTFLRYANGWIKIKLIISNQAAVISVTHLTDQSFSISNNFSISKCDVRYKYIPSYEIIVLLIIIPVLCKDPIHMLDARMLASRQTAQNRRDTGPLSQVLQGCILTSILRRLVQRDKIQHVIASLHTDR